jgi:hypothetical protein
MLRGFNTAFAACIVACSISGAHASAGKINVTISTAPTSNMTFANGVYSPTGEKAVLNINDLTNALNAGNVEVATGSAPGTQAGDIEIKVTFHWVSGYGLTLDAFRSISVQQPVTDAGTGALTLTTNDGGTNGHLQFGAGGNIGFWGLSNVLTINGQPFMLVNSVASLAAAITANPSGNYALAANYDAKVDHTYKQNPITTTFNGNFEGLGNAISNLSMRVGGGGRIGFFNTIGSSASLTAFRLVNINIFQPKSENADVGGLAAESDGTLDGDEVSGDIDAYSVLTLGGLIGAGSGSISHCSSTAAVKSRRYGPQDGGGGLAGAFTGTITDSFASGNVTSVTLTQQLGGLVGLSSGLISHSHATGNVSGLGSSQWFGGLVGNAGGPIVDSYATGRVKGAQGSQGVGGLVGWTVAPIRRSFATGNLPFSAYVAAAGGLAGVSNSVISDSYATGTTPGAGGGETNSGGLVGILAQGSVSASYATGKVTDDGGGFGCNIVPTEVSNDYWDTTSSGTTYGMCNNTNMSGITGLTTTQFQSGLPPGFDPKIWAEDRKIDHGLPYLINNPPPAN